MPGAGPASGHGLPDALPAAVARPCFNPFCRGMASSDASLVKTANSEPRRRSSPRSLFSIWSRTRCCRPGQLMLACRSRARTGPRATQPGFPASRPVLVAWHSNLYLNGRRNAHSNPLFPGSSAPDTVRHRLQGVGQAVISDLAAAADRLRRASLLHRPAHHADREEQFGVHALAGTTRHPVFGTRAGPNSQDQAPLPVRCGGS